MFCYVVLKACYMCTITLKIGGFVITMLGNVITLQICVTSLKWGIIPPPKLTPPLYPTFSHTICCFYPFLIAKSYFFVSDDSVRKVFFTYHVSQRKKLMYSKVSARDVVS